MVGLAPQGTIKIDHAETGRTDKPSVREDTRNSKSESADPTRKPKARLEIQLPDQPRRPT